MSIDKLAAGASIIYYSGESLAGARQATPLEIADRAWELAMAGALDLSQVRLPGGQIAYRATRRRVVDRNPVKAILSDAPSFRRRSAA